MLLSQLVIQTHAQKAREGFGMEKYIDNFLCPITLLPYPLPLFTYYHSISPLSLAFIFPSRGGQHVTGRHVDV